MREHDRLAGKRIPTITGKTQRAQTKRLQRNKHSRKKKGEPAVAMGSALAKECLLLLTLPYNLEESSLEEVNRSPQSTESVSNPYLLQNSHHAQ